MSKTYKLLDVVKIGKSNYPGGPPESYATRYELSEPYKGFSVIYLWENIPAYEWEIHVLGLRDDGAFDILEAYVYEDVMSNDEILYGELGYSKFESAPEPPTPTSCHGSAQMEWSDDTLQCWRVTRGEETTHFIFKLAGWDWYVRSITSDGWELCDRHSPADFLAKDLLLQIEGE